MSRKFRLFVCYARMHVPCILKSSTNTMYRYSMSMCQSMNIDQSYYITGVNKFLKVEHSGLVSK